MTARKWKFWLRRAEEPLQNSEGRPLSILTGLVRDISHRKRVVEANARLAAIVESSSDAIIGKDINGVVTDWNGGAREIFGYEAEEIIGRPITVLLPLDRQHEESAIMERIRRGDRVEHFESVRRTKDGRRIDVSLTISPIRNANGEIVGASKIAREITERRPIDEAALRQYASRLERRIARELHDEIGQSLTAVRITLDRLGRDPTGPEVGRWLADAAALTGTALEQVRDLSRLIRPSLLDDLGLPEALRSLVEGVSTRAGLVADLGIDEVGPGDPDLETACYRIAQEALTNAVKHSGATRLKVVLQRHGDELELIVEDNGIGFDVRAATARARRGSSLGIVSLRERALLAGGRTEVVSRPGGGTRVRALLPLQRPSAGQDAESEGA